MIKLYKGIFVVGIIRSINKLKLKLYKKRYNMNVPDYLHYLMKKEGIEKNKNYIENLFLGSSHCDSGINSNLYENFSAFNLGIGAQDLYQSYQLYKMYVNYLPNLKKVFLCYSVFSTGYEQEKSINANYAYFYDKIFGIPFKLEPKFGNLSKELNVIEKEAKRKIYLYAGYTGYGESIGKYNEANALRDINGHVKHAFRDNNQEQYVIEMTKLAQEHNQRLIVFIPPHSPKYRNLLPEYVEKYGHKFEDVFKPLYEKQKDADFEIINLFDDNRFIQEDFYDLEHLNAYGALKLTKIIKENT